MSDLNLNTNTQTETQAGTRDSFASTFGVIAAAAGSAIGLGNIWKFPYITGMNGGAAFIIVYLICIAVIGFPVMLSEFLIGRKAEKNAIGSFKKLAPGTPWFLTGWMGFLAAFMILSFYGVVAGWSLYYVVQSVTGTLAGLSPEQMGDFFGGFITGTFGPIIWQVIFMILTGYIVYAGVKNGIEKWSKILMPLLLLLIIVLDVRALTLPGAGGGVDFLFKPDFSKLTAAGVLVALGHAFFSLSLGMGTMITYGSYIGKKENLGTTALQVTIADTVIALLAGIAIFPAVFAFGIEPGAGPGLVFITLPNIFNMMPGGIIWSTLFFILLTVAALTSAISILEVVVAYFSEELNMTRHKATWVATISITIVGFFCSLSLGPMSKFLIFGKNFFDLMDWTSANLLLPLGGLFITLFVGWVWGPKKTQEELSNKGELSVSYLNIFMFLCRYLAPIAIAVVFLNGVGLLKF